MTQRAPRRDATLIAECAFVLPVFLFLTLALIIGGLGVFRYQEVSLLAREGARYAAVHGDKYARTTGRAAATDQEIFDNAIKPKATALDANYLTYNVTWSPDKRQGATVTVQVSYQWVPEAIFGKTTLSSTSSLTVQY